MAKFFNDWDVEYPLQEMARDFEIDIEILNSINILVASYTYEHYNGSAFVLFEQDGVLYEVNGSHCSCYGLEDQWEPEEVNLDELEQRFSRKDSYYYEPWYNEVLEVIKEVRELLGK